MKLLPYENITYSTNLPETEVLKRLAENTEPPKFRFFRGNSKDYEGEIVGNTFKISRIIGYRNSFLPRIAGEVGSDAFGTKIKVKMMLHPLVIAFVFIFLILSSFGVVFPIIAFFKGEFSFEVLSFLIVPLFVYGLTMGGFKFESIQSKKYFKNLFQAKIIAD